MLFLFLDYDGTLVPIMGDPGHARLLLRTRNLLKRLLSIFPLAVVSGRSVDQIRRLVGIDQCIYAGNHGLEIQGNGLSFTVPEAISRQGLMGELVRELKGSLRKIPGVLIEDKKLTITVHYRSVEKERISEVCQLTYKTVTPALRQGDIRVTRGKKILEIRPNIAWGKGEAVCWILTQVYGRRWKSRCLPLYIGDDETDREVFKILTGRGISIGVGEDGGTSDTVFQLKDYREVEGFLMWLMENSRDLSASSSHS